MGGAELDARNVDMVWLVRLSVRVVEYGDRKETRFTMGAVVYMGISCRDGHCEILAGGFV